MKKLATSIFLIFTISFLFAQSGGRNTYEFLNLPAGVRTVALGGVNVSHYDDEISFVLSNPALLKPNMNEKVTLNYINYISDINFGYASYAREFKNIGMFAAGLQYINYGNFLYADEFGDIHGDFSAAEYALNISYANQLNSKISYGGSFKAIYSDFYQYFSSGIALDAGISYLDTAKLFSAGLVIKNAGFQLKPYTKGNQEPLPFDIQIGVTQKLKHAPFRFSITAHNLTRWNLRYKSIFDNTYELNTSENLADTTFGQKLTKFMNGVGRVGDELIRHFVIGVEIVPTNNFYLAVSYNYRRRSEMRIETSPKIVGLSFGAGIKLSKFNISYALASYHLAGMSHHISLGLNLSEFYKSQKL